MAAICGTTNNDTINDLGDIGSKETAMIRFKTGGNADDNFDANVLGNPNDNWVMNGRGGDDT
jgi:hypothetical protein